jgi:hypothetical protein
MSQRPQREPQREPQPGRRARRQFGDDVLASAEADAHRHGELRSVIVQYVVLALIGSGFGALGLWKLFSAH